MESNGRSGLFWFAAPRAVCLPCLLPFVLGAVLAGVGVGAMGSYLIVLFGGVVLYRTLTL